MFTVNFGWWNTEKDSRGNAIEVFYVQHCVGNFRTFEDAVGALLFDRSTREVEEYSGWGFYDFYDGEKPLGRLPIECCTGSLSVVFLLAKG